MNKVTTVDPTVIPIIERRLASACHEVATRTMQSAYSVFTAHVRDLGTAIFDDKCRHVASSNWLGAYTAGAHIAVEGMVDHIGRKNIKRRRATIGCTIAGDLKVVQKLWEIGKEDQRLKFKYPLFSLQDAIDLSEFLITATGTFQRFANEVPTVGGEVDIALVTPFEGFQWIKRKKLMKTLEEPK